MVEAIFAIKKLGRAQVGLFLLGPVSPIIISSALTKAGAKQGKEQKVKIRLLKHHVSKT
ncbi:hypothetical protein WBG83_16295 [Paenibacillus sp. y28]